MAIATGRSRMDTVRGPTPVLVVEHNEVGTNGPCRRGNKIDNRPAELAKWAKWVGGNARAVQSKTTARLIGGAVANSPRSAYRGLFTNGRSAAECWVRRRNFPTIVAIVTKMRTHSAPTSLYIYGRRVEVLGPPEIAPRRLGTSISPNLGQTPHEVDGEPGKPACGARNAKRAMRTKAPPTLPKKN